MNYLADYRRMVENQYIPLDKLNGLEYRFEHELVQRITYLTNRLNESQISSRNETTSVLHIMSELSCIKSVLEMTVRVNVLTDARNKEKKYLQARGAVPISKGSRIWAGYYLGPEQKFDFGKNDPNALIEGRTEVVRRVLEGLKNAMGL